MSKLQLEELEDQLATLARQFEALHHQQPRATRNALTAQTRSIFKRYAEHGSEARLRASLRTFLTASHDRRDLTFIAPDASAIPAPPAGGSRMVDVDSAPLMAPPSAGGLPFHLARSFTIPANIPIPPAFPLVNFARLFALYEAEARAVLEHHTEKYGPEAVFVAGIREYYLSKTETIFESTGQHVLGLSPELRMFLREVFERRPNLSDTEKRLLSRAGRVPLATVRAFWEHSIRRRRSYFAMRTVIAAKEMREIIAEKKREEERKGGGNDDENGETGENVDQHAGLLERGKA